MYQSYVNGSTAAGRIRATGVDARVATQFIFETQAGQGGDIESSQPGSEAKAPDSLVFTVLGPGNVEVINGAIDVPPPENTPPRQGGRAYQMQLFVGRPGILGPGHARYIAGFPSQLTASPVLRAAPLQAGPTLAALSFQLESAMHIPQLRVAVLPPWGYAEMNSARKVGADQSRAPPREAPRIELGEASAMEDVGEAPRIDPSALGKIAMDWKQGEIKMKPTRPDAQAETGRRAAEEGESGKEAFPWHLSEL